MFKHAWMQLLLLTLLASFASTNAFAQTATAGAVNGRIVDQTGAPVANVQVEIVHVPSGTRRSTATDDTGRFAGRGLRVGGPYIVSATRSGYRSAAQENLFLDVGDAAVVNLVMEQAVGLDEIVVLGSRTPGVFDSMQMGAGTTVGREQIEQLPTISRNIQDFVRTDPRISQVDKERGEISAGGQNTRFNNIRVDGVSVNDGFGLEANNLPTNRQPVTLDSVESINISLVNYDVALGGYTGASVDAVTRSGTNDFSGSLYYIYRDQDWTGKRDGVRFTGFEDEKTWGATLGGPIVRDRLFFFASFERFNRAAAAPTFGPAGSGAADEVPGISQAAIAEVQDIAQNVWGFDPGSFTPPASLDRKIDDILLKIDWNITDDHRASFRYNKTEQEDPNLRGLGSRSLSLSSYWDTSIKEYTGYVAQLFSDWTDSFSTEVKVGYAQQRANFELGSRLPQIRICLNSPSGNCQNSDNIFIGTERFRHVNELETDTLNVFAAGNYFIGNHEIKFGVDYQSQDVFNLFGRDQFGVYDFFGIDAFRTGTPGTYALFFPTQGGVETRAADWKLNNWGFFLQDTWNATDKLTLTYGLRYDLPKVPGSPAFNANASQIVGIRNDNTIDGNGLLQPRFGFNYSPETERRTQIRGGLGLFQGISANVWLSNPFSVNAITQNNISLSGAAAAAIAFSPDPDNQPGDRPPPGVGGNVDFVDPNLKQPAVWKGNLAIDHELPGWGVIASAELVLTEVQNGIYYEKPNLGAPTGFLPDGRPYYWSTVDPATFTGGFNQAASQRNPALGLDSTIARPTNKGRGRQLTLSLQSPADENWFWNLGYTRTNATEVNPLTSSQAASNWNNSVRVDRNANIAENSIYAIRDRLTASVSYQRSFFQDLRTSFGLFYEGRSGRPFTYTFAGDANGDGRSNVDPFYVPSGPGDVIFTGGAEMEAAFFDFLSRERGLARQAGQVAGVNVNRSPWVSQVDLRLSQEIPAFLGAKGEVWLDVLNVGNLINSKWGQIEEIGFPFNKQIAQFRGIDPESGRLVYTFNEANVRDQTLRDFTGESRWAVQSGARFTF
ncbi:MAG: TonB-dependent receptor [Gammaproteobacteria bacterium]|nr:TonB-dependent receptor [Gammaproteobacteria bacterium]